MGSLTLCWARRPVCHCPLRVLPKMGSLTLCWARWPVCHCPLQVLPKMGYNLLPFDAVRDTMT